MYEQNASYLVQHSELGAKNLNKICVKLVQKVLKWPQQHVKFPGERAPGPPTAFFLISICFKIILQKNCAQK